MKKDCAFVLAAAMAMLGAPSARADWSGVHVGLFAGGGFGAAPSTTSTAANANAAHNYTPFDAANLGTVNGAGVEEVHPGGGTFGADVGYDKQFGKLLIGVEADGGYFSTSGTSSNTFRYPDVNNIFTVSQTVSTDWLATARPRVGWLASSDLLFYLTGGMAATNFKYNAEFSDNFAQTHGLGPAVESSAASKTAIGWTVGTGLEFKLVGKLTLKAEYLHAEFGRINSTGVLSVNGGAFVNTFTHTASLNEDILRVGINRRF